MMRGFVHALFGSLVMTIVVGCSKPVGTAPVPPASKVEADPGKPAKSVPAETAGEPDKNLVAAGRQQLQDNKYTPMPVYSRRGSLGIIRLIEGNIGKLEDAIVVFEDKDITDSRLKLENGYVFFNVDKTGPVKVGDFELKKGECVLFSNGQFSKLDLLLSVNLPSPLPKEIVDAWTAAGASIGWGQVDKHNLTEFKIRPEGLPGELPLISFLTGNGKDGVLAKLPAPTAAFGLDLSFSQLTDAGVKELGSLTNLQWLKLSGTAVTEEGLKELNGLKNLQWLGLGFTKISDAGLKELASLESLQFLDLENTPVTGTGLTELKTVRWLYLGGSQVTDAGLHGLGQLKNLQWLSLGATSVTDAVCKELSELENLQTLSLSATQVTDAGLKELAGLKSLHTLSLFNTKVTDTGLKELAELNNLQTLELDFRPITNAGLQYLSGLKSLHSLSLERTEITDAGLKELTGLVNLKLLYLAGTKITEAGLNELRKALPQCRIVQKTRFAE